MPEPPQPTPAAITSLYADRPYTRFMILGDARSGSTVLVNALNSHPAVRCFREPFNWAVNFIDYAIDGWDPTSAADLALRKSDTPRFIAERLFCAHDAGVSAVGFKFLYPHFWGFPGLVEELQADADLRVIHIVRRNSLRALVSLRIAQATGRWVDDSARKGDKGVAVPNEALMAGGGRRGLASALRMRLSEVARRIGISRPASTVQDGKTRVRLAKQECFRYFEDAAKQHEHWAQMFDGHPLLTVEYETLLAEPSAVYDAVQDFLGLEKRDLSVTMRRQNPEPLKELLLNYEDLERAFASTSYAGFFS